MRQYGIVQTLPVRRKLFACCAAYLMGIYCTEIVCIPVAVVVFMSVLFLAAAIVCRKQRRSALLFAVLLFLLAGNFLMNHQLSIRDAATAPGVRITGTVSRILSQTRVYLTDVQIEGGALLKRPAAVSLMTEEDESGNPVTSVQTVHVGQQISGTGRLFEQDAVRNPGGIDRRIWALCDGYDVSGYLVPGWTVSGERVFSVSEVFRRIREALSTRISSLFGEHAALLQAVMIGDREQLDEDVVQAMRLTGIAHLLTISGMHLSILSYALSACMRKLRIGRRFSFVCQTVILGLFVGVTGFAAGTVRAYIMSVNREVARLTGRRYDSLTSLAAAALLMTLIQPVWAMSASFQFSFFVVLGILLLSRQMIRLFRGKEGGSLLRVRFARAVALSVSAQLSAIPMQLAFYGYIPLLALPMNLFGGLLMPIVMMGGWFAVLLSIVSVQLASCLAGGIGFAAAALEAVSVAAASGRWCILRMPAPYLWSLLAVAALMMTLSPMVSVGRHRMKMSAVLAAVIALSYGLRMDNGAKYVQLDVGQGDAAVIRSGRQAVLIDVGPEDRYDALRYLRHEGLTADLVILSHLDEDHAGALGALLDSEIEIRRIALPVGAFDALGSQHVRQAMERAEAMGISIEAYEAGDVIQAKRVSLSVLSPTEGLRGSNERSLVLYADIAGMRLLTLGDLPEDCEVFDIPDCDVLKVAHHASRSATSAELIEKARPEVAMISVGRNSYGHPTDRVLLDLQEVGADVYRTDRSGCLTAEMIDGECVVSCYIN